VSKAHARKVRRRRRLHQRDPNCHWCGRHTVLPESPKAWTVGRGYHRVPAPHQATIDHLDSRLSDQRGAFIEVPMERTVLACWACNQERSRAEVAARRPSRPPA